MKHKHYEMIVAKAANMDLVVFFKASFSSEWGEVSNSLLPAFHPETEYFLCIPKHKDACLHWLNGGEVQTRRECSDLGWDRLLPPDEGWSKISHFMCVDILLRIKPKKEKRWIAVLPNGRVSGWHDEGREMLEEQYNKDAGWQFIEIEVEI